MWEQYTGAMNWTLAKSRPPCGSPAAVEKEEVYG
jgi:hypothetical protein